MMFYLSCVVAEPGGFAWVLSYPLYVHKSQPLAQNSALRAYKRDMDTQNDGQICNGFTLSDTVQFSLGNIVYIEHDC